jgi:hypothetical protein
MDLELAESGLWGVTRDVAYSKRIFEILCFAVRVVWVFGRLHDDRRLELAAEEA